MEKMIKKKQVVKLAILAMALVQMGTNGIAPALSGIAAAFPNVSPSAVQYLMTFPSLIVVGVSLCASELSARIPKKYITACGCVLSALGGALAALFHTGFFLLFVWAGIIGVGIGLIVPMIYGFITDLFEGRERASMMGNATSSSNLGSMLMTLIGGCLAAKFWALNYLVYFITIPALFLSLTVLPGIRSTDVKTAAGDAEMPAADGAKRFGPHVAVSAVFAGLFLFLFNAGPTNLSMLVSEFGLGSAAAAGSASSMFLLGGTVMGFFFEKVFRIFKEYIFSVGALVMAAGFLLIGHAPNMGILCIGCFLAGSSISFAMPKCMYTASLDCTPVQATFAMSFVMAAGNLGTFATPALTAAATALSGSDSVIPRFNLAVVLVLILSAVAFVRARRKMK